MHQPVHALIHRHEKAEIGDVLDLAMNMRADRMGGNPGLPGVFGHRFQAQTQPARRCIHLQHGHIHHIAFGQHLRRFDIAFCPAQLGAMNHPLDAGFQFHHGAEIEQPTHRTGQAHARLIGAGHMLPRVALQRLHRYRHLTRFGIQLDNFSTDLLTDRQHLGGVFDSTPGNIGYMQQRIDAAQIDKSAEIGHALDRAGDFVANPVPLEKGRSLHLLLGSHRFFSRHHNIIRLATRLQNRHLAALTNQTGRIDMKIGVGLRARHECIQPVQIDPEPALHFSSNHRIYRRVVRQSAFDGCPCSTLFGGQNRQTYAGSASDRLHQRINLIADCRNIHTGLIKFSARNRALRLGADIDNDRIMIDADHHAANHFAAFNDRLLFQRGLEHLPERFLFLNARRIRCRSFRFSFCY